MKIKTEFDFSAAHRLVNYEGKCKNLHGHNYKVEVEVYGEMLEQGMLIDFNKIKKIKDVFDHKTILEECKENAKLIKAVKETCPDCLFLMPQTPTAENLGLEILKILKLENSNLKYKIKVYENSKSCIEVE